MRLGHPLKSEFNRNAKCLCVCIYRDTHTDREEKIKDCWRLLALMLIVAILLQPIFAWEGEGQN